MSKRVIKTGLSKKYKDMLDAVIGQMSDGYWENTPMMRGYWKFVTTGTSGDEVTLEVDEMSGARDGDRRLDNRFYGMSDDAVKKFFADKIKFLIKEEGLGKWDRGNESETDFLSYDRPRYRVKDCYYAYEILKGRNTRKHPEYGDVAEAKNMAKIRMIEKSLPTYRVIYWAHRPGEVGMRGYYKDVQAKDDDDAIVAFNTWVDACDDIPDGTDVEIRRIELKT